MNLKNRNRTIQVVLQDGIVKNQFSMNKRTYNQRMSEMVCIRKSTGIRVPVVYYLNWQVMLLEVIIWPEWVEDNDLLYH